LLETFVFALAFLASASLHAAQVTISVAAAADLKFALDEITGEFQKTHNQATVQVTYGSSGNFYSQLSQRAPFDIFFSADVSYPTKLVEAGLGVADSKFSYAVGRIVAWTPTNSLIDPLKLGIESLKHPLVRKIAIANPEHAPYGKAAVAAVKDKLVFGENIAQTAQFVDSGAADIGIIALSLAVAPAMKDKGRYWEIPLDAYPRLNQGGIILPWAKNPKLAQEFKTFVLSASGKTILRRYGFFMPDE
jgi:molybdate transport system substrate-binding protein